MKQLQSGKQVSNVVDKLNERKNSCSVSFRELQNCFCNSVLGIRVVKQLSRVQYQLKWRFANELFLSDVLQLLCVQSRTIIQRSLCVDTQLMHQRSNEGQKLIFRIMKSRMASLYCQFKKWGSLDRTSLTS